MKKLLLLVFLIGTTAFHTQGKIREKRSIVRLETAMGNIRIALNDETPVHRDNFLKLVSEGFYDGTLFHRVVKDFVIQATRIPNRLRAERYWEKEGRDICWLPK